MSKATPNLALPPRELMDQEPVKVRFMEILSGMHGMSEQDAMCKYEKERTYYKQILSASPNLTTCKPISLLSSFLESAINNLSLQPIPQGESFLESRGAKTGRKTQDGKDEYENVCRFVITGYGELAIRIRAGQIKALINLTVVYKDDLFKPCTNDAGEMVIRYSMDDEERTEIKGVFCMLVLPDGKHDPKWLLKNDIERLKKYSISKSGRDPKANALYSSNNGQIDPGFLQAKMIKHAFKNYGRAKISPTAVLEGDDADEEQEVHDSSFCEKKEIVGVSVERTDEENPM